MYDVFVAAFIAYMVLDRRVDAIFCTDVVVGADLKRFLRKLIEYETQRANFSCQLLIWSLGALS